MPIMLTGVARLKLRRLIREHIETVLLAITIFVVLQASIQHFKVNGQSMQPTLGEGERLVVNKLVYFSLDQEDIADVLPFVDTSPSGSGSPIFAFSQPRHGDVIIFHFPLDPTRDFVKRIIGVPGDTIEIERGQVFRNGVAIEEPYVTKPDRRSADAVDVPEGSYYVLGDNRSVSTDSREWGMVPAENVVGRMWFRYWPFHGLNNLLGTG